MFYTFKFLNSKFYSLFYLPHLHAEVSLGKMLNPEYPLIEQKSAASRCTVWMCVWKGECQTVLWSAIYIHTLLYNIVYIIHLH